jgi:hypothetical protein
LSKAHGAGFHPQPGKEGQFQVALDGELPASGVMDRRGDIGLIFIGVEYQEDKDDGGGEQGRRNADDPS